jgi:hypothetical protein
MRRGRNVVGTRLRGRSAPRQSRWEVGNAATAGVKRRRLTQERARQLLTDFESVTIRELAIDIVRAVDLGLELGIDAYDAYVLEAARSSVGANNHLLTNHSLPARRRDRRRLRRPEGPGEALHNFLHNPRLGPLTRGIVGDFFETVWRGERGAEMGDVKISGRICTGRGPRNRRPRFEAFCARSDVTYTYSLR